MRSAFREMPGPFDQLRLACVSGEPTQCVDLRMHDNLFTKQPHGFCAVDERAPECAARLKSDYHDLCFVAPEVVFQMMTHASAGAHAAAGNDDGAGGDAINCH